MSFNFPIIKNINAKSLTDDILSVLPMTQEDAAKGRPIKPFPTKYDTFADIESFKEYIRYKTKNSASLKTEWLEVSKIVSMPINIDDDVYYSSTQCLDITCYMPSTNMFDDIVLGESICNLELSWDINKIQKAIDEIKNENK